MSTKGGSFLELPPGPYKSTRVLRSLRTASQESHSIPLAIWVSRCFRTVRFAGRGCFCRICVGWQRRPCLCISLHLCPAVRVIARCCRVPVCRGSFSQRENEREAGASRWSRVRSQPDRADWSSFLFSTETPNPGISRAHTFVRMRTAQSPQGSRGAASHLSTDGPDTGLGDPTGGRSRVASEVSRHRVQQELCFLPSKITQVALT